MKTILITAIGGDIGQAVASIVRRTFPDWRILGCDIHARHAGELFVNQWFVAPRADDAGYLPWLEKTVREQGVDLCVPMSEAELSILAGAGGGRVGNAGLVMANGKAIAVGGDKLATARFMAAADLPVPWTIPAGEVGVATPFPCIFKARRGAGSKSVFICNSLEEAHFLARRHPESVFQELLLPEEREVTCAIYRTRDGRIAVLQLLRRLAGGFSGWAKVMDSPELRGQCERIAEALALEGSINAQFRITDSGPRLFEINPRFSSTILMRHLMGYQDVVWALRESMGERVEPVIPKVGTVGVRTQGAELMGVQPAN